MANININESLCKGCELCVDACPKGIVALAKDRLNAKGYHPACVTDINKCTACAFCAIICPDVAISVQT